MGTRAATRNYGVGSWWQVLQCRLGGWVGFGDVKLEAVEMMIR